MPERGMLHSGHREGHRDGGTDWLQHRTATASGKERSAGASPSVNTTGKSGSSLGLWHEAGAAFIVSPYSTRKGGTSIKVQASNGKGRKTRQRAKWRAGMLGDCCCWFTSSNFSFFWGLFHADAKAVNKHAENACRKKSPAAAGCDQTPPRAVLAAPQLKACSTNAPPNPQVLKGWVGGGRKVSTLSG